VCLHFDCSSFKGTEVGAFVLLMELGLPFVRLLSVVSLWTVIVCNERVHFYYQNKWMMEVGEKLLKYVNTALNLLSL
jgi:hypothetical protein